MHSNPGNDHAAATGPIVPSPGDVFAGAGDALACLRSTDWAQTPLGPVDQWPEELVQAVRITLPSGMPMLIWWGPELIQLYNDAFAEMIGDKHPAGIGQPAKKCWVECWSDLAPFADWATEYGESRFAEDMLLLVERHGYLEETYFTFSCSPIRNARGQVVGVFVVMSDVTARVVGNRRLETVRQLGTVSAASAGTLEQTCKAAIEVLSANRQAVPFAAMYLVEPDDSLARLVASYGVGEGTAVTPAGPFVLEDNPSIAKAVASGARGLVTGLRESIPQEAFERGPLGDEVPDAAMVLPVSISGMRRPTAVAVLGVNAYRAVDDVYLTFFQLVARQLRVALADAMAYESEQLRAIALVELDEDKSRFYQNVSHEFRTPLTLILGPLRSVLDDASAQLTPRHRESLIAAMHAGLRLRKLVDGLLEFSRVEADELRAEFEPTDISRHTAELAGMFGPVIEQAGLEYLVDVDTIDGLVDVDREMWAEIVLNLLSNAVKFTHEGSIQVRLRSDGDQIRLSVHDTGIGVPAAQLPKIFDRFAQVPGQSGRSAEGTGIGLALVAALTSAHGGKVQAQSEPGEGTTITVSVPRTTSVKLMATPAANRMSEAGADVYVLEAESWIRQEPEPDQERSTDSAIGRLLLVEDNADMRAYLVQLLARDGWNVHAVSTVEDAVGVQPAPDVVLSDIMLPGSSGIELVRMLREDPALRRIPVILLTARTGPAAAAEGLKSGADDYIVKPFDPAELLARVRVHHELTTLRDLARSQAEDKADNLQRALDSNRQIGIALGLLMARDKMTESQAFDRLREVSQHQNRKLRDVADDIVFTGSIPAVDSADHSPAGDSGS